MIRTLVATYYGPADVCGGYPEVVKVTRGSRIEEALPNVTRNMTLNRYGAVVADVVDDEYGELLLVATYHIGESFRVAFERDVTRPICVTNLEKE